MTQRPFCRDCEYTSLTDGLECGRQPLSPTTRSPPTMPDDCAKLTYDGQTLDLNVIEGTEGEKAVDIESLRAKTGLVTLDPSYGNTGSTTSKITFIDGEKGALRYRGYPIDQLATKSNFV